MKRFTVCFLTIALFLSISDAVAFGFNRRIDYNVPKPVLLSPIGDEQDISGKSSLEFRWSPHEGRSLGRKYYELKLYKGYEMLEKTLISKQRIKAGESMINMDAAQFKNGEIYTWSLRQVLNDGQKSDRAFASFRVIKNGDR